jgi:hypothetical protein
VANGFKEIDKGTRSRLLDCLEQRTEIERWRSILTASERWQLNHPNAVLRKWKARTSIPDAGVKSKVSRVAKYKEQIVRLDEENHRLRAELERRGIDIIGVAETSGEAAGRSRLGADSGDTVALTKAESKRREVFKKLLLRVWGDYRFVIRHAAKELGLTESEFKRLLNEFDLKRPWEKNTQEAKKTTPTDQEHDSYVD